MKKGTILTGVIEGIDFPDKGYFHAEDRKVEVKSGLPGQKVSVQVTKDRHGKASTRLLEVLERSPEEMESPCPMFGICGSCTYLTLPIEKELTLKQVQVAELLQKAMNACPAEALGENGADEAPTAPTAAGTPAWKNVLSWYEGILPSPKIYGFRNKMELSFGNAYKDGPLTLGMHRRGSFYDVVDADQCVIVDEDYRKIIGETKRFFAERNVPFFHRMVKTGYLRHLLVRKASYTGQILIDLVTSGDTSSLPVPEEELLAEYAKLMVYGLGLKGDVVGVLHTVNNAVSDSVQDDGTTILYGQGSFTEKLLGLTFEVTPFSFLQPNSYSAEVLYNLAVQWISGIIGSGTPLIYDLYSGTGTISQLLAPAARKVIGVEIVPEAVEAARENAKRNGIKNCEFLCGDVLQILDSIEEKPDLIVLDPPRDGIHPKALPKIAGYGVPYILYISCKPTSLARDLPLFAAHGYHPVAGASVDQFVWSPNVETIVLLKMADVPPQASLGKL